MVAKGLIRHRFLATDRWFARGLVLATLSVLPVTAVRAGPNYVTLDFDSDSTFLTGIRGDNLVGDYVIPGSSPNTGGLLYRLDDGAAVCAETDHRDVGMGHAVLTSERLDEVVPFYTEILNFKPSDYILKPFKAYFFHINARHHSLAFIQTGKNAVHHIMMELFSFDDVGQGYDIALGEAGRVATTLGRHTSDFITSFYTWTPSAFMVALVQTASTAPTRRTWTCCWPRSATSRRPSAISTPLLITQQIPSRMGAIAS